MRKAFTFVEIVVVLAVLPALTVALSLFFATFIRDIPRMTRLVERNTTALHVIQQLRDDMDQAVALPDTAGDKTSDDHTLLIALPEHVVCYELQEGKATRRVLDGHSDMSHTWRFPDVVLAWSRWQENGAAYAVEIDSHVNQTIGSKVKQRLVNAHVLFLHGFRKDVQ